MIDIAYENIIQFNMLDDTLDGRALLESKVSQTIGEGKNKEFQNVIKLYFDLDNLEEKQIFFEVEKYVSDGYLSNKKYLLLQAPSGNSSYFYSTTTKLDYILGTTFKLDKNKEFPKRLNMTQNSKNCIKVLFDEDDLNQKIKEIFFKILIHFYRYRILEKKDKNVYLTFCSKFCNIDTQEVFNIKKFIKKYQNNNIFTIGFILNGNKYLLSENEEYVNYLVNREKKSFSDSKLKVYGICDFCKKTKKLIDIFGKGNYPLKHLKNFTSTKPSVLYENNKKTLEKNIRCCVECFRYIYKADYQLSFFKIGELKEIKIKSEKNKKNSKEKTFYVYAFIDTPFKQSIDYESIQYAMEVLFGNENALDTAQKVVRNEDIFDEDWNIILNVFIIEKEQGMNQSVLNLRNINPYLFRKYYKIFEFINDLNQELTNRYRKGNFSDIFSTISKADKRVSFEIFEAFLTEKDLDIEGLIKRFLPLVKKKFLFSEKDKKEKLYKMHYENLLLDITNILIIDNLRKKENVLAFDIMDLIETYENKDKKKLYRKRDVREIVKALGFEWSDLEVRLFDLGMVIQETVSDIKSSKSTDIEKVFMRKLDFTGMRVDEIMNYIGYMEQKFQDYKNFIYSLDDKRERLTYLSIALNQEGIEISPQKSAYLIAFGYEMSLTISNKIGKIVNQEKKETKNGNK